MVDIDPHLRRDDREPGNWVNAVFAAERQVIVEARKRANSGRLL